MQQHYTSNTVEVTAWCDNCTAFTPHSTYSVSATGRGGRRAGPCLNCIRKKEDERTARLAEEALAPKQASLLFAEST